MIERGSVPICNVILYSLLQRGGGGEKGSDNTYDNANYYAVYYQEFGYSPHMKYILFQ